VPKKLPSQGGLNRRKRSRNHHSWFSSGDGHSIPCELLLLSECVQAYKKEGPKFVQRLIAKQKARRKDRIRAVRMPCKGPFRPRKAVSQATP